MIILPCESWWEHKATGGAGIAACKIEGCSTAKPLVKIFPKNARPGDILILLLLLRKIQIAFLAEIV
jgi:hypothetical protein